MLQDFTFRRSPKLSINENTESARFLVNIIIFFSQCGFYPSKELKNNNLNDRKNRIDSEKNGEYFLNLP